jgi:hypothetical protein
MDNKKTLVIPMNGYHYTKKRGFPMTFDAEGYC